MIDLVELMNTKPAAALAAIQKNKKLLAWRTKPNKSSPLMLAAFVGATRENGHLGALRLLIKANANLDARTATGESALSLALALGEHDCVAELIRAGADPSGKTKRGRDLDDVVNHKDPGILRAAIERGIKLPPKTYDRALADDNVELVVALLDAGHDKGGKRAAAWAAKTNFANARAALEQRGIEVPASKGPVIETLGYAGAKALLAELGLRKKLKHFPTSFTDRALVYRGGLRLAKMRLDETFAIDGKRGPVCGAGIIVIGDLVVDGTLENGEQDFGPFLVVTGNLTAKNIAISGAEVLVGGNLKVKGAFHGYYNHGSTTVLGTTDVGLLIADDYNMTLEGTLKGTFITRPGYVKSKHKIPKEAPLERLAKPFLELDEDEQILKGHAIYKALVAGKKLTR